jgi:hypothetical protein
MIQVGPMLKNNMCGIESIQQINDYEDEDDVVAFDNFDYVIDAGEKSNRSRID